MAFIESPRFPEAISQGARRARKWSTTVVEVASGREQRNRNWTYPRYTYEVAHNVRTAADAALINAFLEAIAGRADGFRFRDHADATATQANGLLGAGIGAGVPGYQLIKRYSYGAISRDRPITKPVSGSVAVYRNAAPVTFGAAAGNCALNTATGIVTFVADATSASSAITPGATTQVVLASNLGLIAGKLLYLSGFAGADAASVNALAHTINSITGAGPYTFTLATNTSGKTITLGSGAGAKYPQASDTLAWTGQFDVPVRFDSDQIWSQMAGPLANDGSIPEGWDSIPLIEIRV